MVSDEVTDMNIRPLLAFLGSSLLSAPVSAADNKALVDYQAMTTETALHAARAALDACREQSYQVSVAVVDRGGNVQVLLRDRFAGAHTPDTAVGKAWTAVSFRTNTLELSDQLAAGDVPSGLQNLPGVVIIGGGVRVEAAGSTIGGIGVSGAPSGSADEMCANAGIDAIFEQIEF